MNDDFFYVKSHGDDDGDDHENHFFEKIDHDYADDYDYGVESFDFCFSHVCIQ